MRNAHKFRSAMMIPILWGSLFSAAFAHSMYQSAVMFDFRSDVIEAELQLPVDRLATALGIPTDAPSLLRERPSISAYVVSRFHASLPDGRPFSVRLSSPVDVSNVDGAPYCIVRLLLTPPVQSGIDRFELRDDVLLDRIPDQAALVSIRSDWATSTFANDPKLIGVLRGNTRSLMIDRPDASWFRGFNSIFRLGMNHIAEGTDHLLFLLSLLLPAPLLVLGKRWAGFAGVRHSLLQILKVVTAFTLGHSITLAASAFSLVRVPARPIEILIAVSILVSAIHAFRPIFPGRESVIAASFGLIHGLAFATTLAELGLGRWERVAGIFGFNLGIEAMQLIVVAAAMPPLILLSRTALYPAIRVTGALFAAVASAGWIVQRTFNTYNPVDIVIEALARHAAWLAIGLLLLGIVAWTCERLFAQRLSSNSDR